LVLLATHIMKKKTLNIFEIEQVQKIDSSFGNTLTLTLRGSATEDGIVTKLTDIQDIDEISFGTTKPKITFVKKKDK